MSETLRLDLFLKRCGLLKRRSISKEACETGLVLVDGHAAKPGRQIAVGQRLTLLLPGGNVTADVVGLPRSAVPKASVDLYCRMPSNVTDQAR